MLKSVCFCWELHVLTLNQPRCYVRPKIGHCHSRKDEGAPEFQWVALRVQGGSNMTGTICV
jgi:hypothetical protein